MKRFLNLVLFILTVCCTAPASAQQSNYTVALSRPSQPGRLVSKIHSASFKVIGTNDTAVSIRITKDGKPYERAGLDYNFHENGNTVTILERSSVEKSNGVIEIRLPRAFSLELETYWNNSIDISNINGPVKIKTFRGAVEARNISGDVNAKSQTGNLMMENVTGNLTVSSFSGKIAVRNLSGAIIADNTQSDILVHFTKTSATIPSAFSNTQGDIEVFFPPDLKANFSIGNFKGKTNCAFKLEAITNKALSEQQLAIYRKVNGGGVEISFKNLSGAINIRKSQ